MGSKGAVVNIINHESAYCLYPYTTLEEHSMVLQHFADYRRPYTDIALAKCEDRGFRLVDMANAADAEKIGFPLGIRRVDDGWSFRVPWTMDQDVPPSTIGLHTWNVNLKNGLTTLDSVLCRSSRLKHSYILTGDMDEMENLWDIVQAMYPGDGCV